MPSTLTQPNPLAARLRLAALAVVVLATAIAVGATDVNARTAKELGKSSVKAPPACPDNPNTMASECNIIGQVTGFQRAIRGKANVFKAREKGRIVGWSVDLSRPSKDERKAFGEAGGTKRFGESPTAGVSIIRKAGKGKFKLIRQSPILKVQGYYGQRPYFTLNQPLRMRRGDIVALTTATWLPNFAIKRTRRSDVWVGSRSKKNCELPTNPAPKNPLQWYFAHSSPHRKDGTTRGYRCTYREARLLYWAYFVPAG